MDSNNIYQSSGTADWVQTENARARKRNRRADAPGDPNAGVYNPAGPATPGGDYLQQAPPVSGPAGLGGFPETISGGGGSMGVSTDPATYDRQARAASLAAFPGSFVATTVPRQGDNPYALGAFANNPILIANAMLKSQYGLPAGSNVAGAMASLFDPKAKALGMGGVYPKNNVDWINMGASLMNSLKASTGGGWQFDPKTMMQNAAQAVMAEVKTMMAGGSGSGDEFQGPLQELAHEDPGKALQDFVSLIQGMLAGTMPSEEIDAYANFLLRSGSAFLQDFYQSSDAAGMEANGLTFISALIQKLGPSLGL